MRGGDKTTKYTSHIRAVVQTKSNISITKVNRVADRDEIKP